MEQNEVITLEDRGFIEVKGAEAKDFLQNIVTNDIEKATVSSTLFSSILTPQGKYLFEFFVLKLNDGYLLECEKKSTIEIIKLLNFYKLRSKIDLIDSSEKYVAAVISLEKFKEINNSNLSKGNTVSYRGDQVYIDPRNNKLGAKIISKLESIYLTIKKLNLKIGEKKKYYNKSFELGIPQIGLDKLRSKVSFADLSEKYVAAVISLEKFKEIDNSDILKGKTIFYRDAPIYIDPRNEKLGAKIISKLENIHLTIKKLNLVIADKKKYYNKSFMLGIPQIELNKLKDKIFGIENNLDELNGIDFKKGCYIGQENTSRIKLRNKLRRRILPIQKIDGEIHENDTIKYNGSEIGKVMINKPYSFALIKVVDPDLKEFNNTELVCGTSKVKILKPEWI